MRTRFGMLFPLLIAAVMLNPPLVAAGDTSDADQDGWTVEQGDCNDMNETINPGATELCDEIDNDCDASFDETFPDKGGPCECGAGTLICNGGGDGLACEITQPASSCALADVDGNGLVEPLTDMLLLLRWSFGFTGNALTAGAVSGGCSRCTAEEIIGYIEQNLLVSP